MKIALITGITGQDGSYLAEFLLEKSYKVYGIIRRTSSQTTQRLESIFKHLNLKLLYGDLTDNVNIIQILNQIRSENIDFSILEIYNLGAQSHVKVSFEIPLYTAQVDALGVLSLIEGVRQLNISDKVRIYQASTSELYGEVLEIPQSETTPFNPRSPYAAAKLYAYWICKNYREAYNMFICNGILFNHTSPRRGHTFCCRKITRAVAQISKGKQDCLVLGNLDAKRDWGHAKDYIEAMWLILQQDKPVDYVVSMNETHTVRKFVELSFQCIGVNITWFNEGIDEVGKDQNGNIRVRINPKYFRPTEVELLIGDSTKIRNEIGWTPKYTLEEIIREMVDRDIKCDNLY
jgi:GDPmannose 4,6-dehydratase